MENKIKIKQICLNISGVKKERKILQITDLHLYLSDNREHPNRVKAYKWRYDNYWTVNGIKPEERLPLFLDYANQHNDLVVFTGDMFDVPSQRNFEFFDENLEKLNDYIYVLGNHDWSFMDWLYKVERYGKTPKVEDYHNKYTKQKYWPLFKKYAKNLYQEAFIYDDLILATIYTGDEDCKRSHIKFLKDLNKLGKPIILFTHTPFFAVDDHEFVIKTSDSHKDNRIASPDRKTSKYGLKVYEIINSKESNIKAIIVGHRHFESMGYTIGGVPQYITAGSYWGDATEFIIKGK